MARCPAPGGLFLVVWQLVTQLPRLLPSPPREEAGLLLLFFLLLGSRRLLRAAGWLPLGLARPWNHTTLRLETGGAGGGRDKDLQALGP